MGKLYTYQSLDFNLSLGSVLALKQFTLRIAA
jgi:hypothetical protein